jgi:hypothetical protein
MGSVKYPTALQRRVLAQISNDKPLCYSSTGRWFFNGGRQILSGTGRSLLTRGWIVARPRRRHQLVWLTEYVLSERGQVALNKGKA